MSMAKRLLSATSEPTRQQSLDTRLHHIVTLVQQNSVKAVVIYDVNVCEPEWFDLPHLKQALQAEGVPCLYVESSLKTAFPIKP